MLLINCSFVLLLSLQKNVESSMSPKSQRMARKSGGNDSRPLKTWHFILQCRALFYDLFFFSFPPHRKNWTSSWTVLQGSSLLFAKGQGGSASWVCIPQAPWALYHHLTVNFQFHSSLLFLLWPPLQNQLMKVNSFKTPWLQKKKKSSSIITIGHTMMQAHLPSPEQFHSLCGSL